MARTERTKVVGYVRVSTVDQAEEGVSLPAQRAKLEAYALAMDLDLVAIHEDAGVSAKTLDRPGLSAALAALDAGKASAILVLKLDRLTRSVADLGTLLDRYFATRFDLLSVSDSVDTRTAGGRLVLNVLVSVAQWEREAIAERTKLALHHLRDHQGVRLGAEALGWKRTDAKDGEGRRVVEEDQAELATVQRIRFLRRRGLSLRAICTQLAEEKRQTKRGGKWTAKVVRSVLMRSEAKAA